MATGDTEVEVGGGVGTVAEGVAVVPEGGGGGVGEGGRGGGGREPPLLLPTPLSLLSWGRKVCCDDSAAVEMGNAEGSEKRG